MKLTYCSTAGLILSSMILASCLSSCVNQEYDFDKLNTEITVGSEGLTLPLGKTAPITLKELLSNVDQSVLEAVEGGSYTFKFADTLALGDQLPDLKEMLKIEDVSFNDKFTFNMAEFNADDFSMAAETFDYSFSIGGDGLGSDINVPYVQKDYKQKLGVAAYAKKAESLSFNLQNHKFNTGDIFSLPSLGTVPPGIEITISDQEVPIKPIDKSFTIEMNAPEGISNISDIKLSDKSGLTIEVSVRNSFLSKGELIPNLTLDLGGLLTISGAGSINVGSEFSLSDSNNYTHAQSYSIDAINLLKSNWTGSKFSQTNTMSVSGTVKLKNAATNSQKINGYTGGISLDVNVSYSDVKIASFMMDIADVGIEEEIDVDLNIGDIVLPDGVKKIDQVKFTDASAVDMKLLLDKAFNGLNVNLNSLSIAFPNELSVVYSDGSAPGAGNTLVYSDKDLVSGFADKIFIRSMTPPEPVDGEISFRGKKVVVKAKATANGRISSKDLPKTEDKDVEFSMNISSNIAVEDYQASVSSYNHELAIEPKIIRYRLPAEAGSFGTMSVYPEGTPRISVKLTLPDPKEIGLNLMTGNDGITITFPDFICFKKSSIPSGYNYNEEKNSITLKGELPDNISLDLEKLIVTPVKDEEVGDYVVQGEVTITGNVCTEEGSVNSNNINNISNSTIYIEAYIPEMKAASVSLDRFDMELDQTFDFTVLEAKNLPAEIISVSEADLENVYATFLLTFDNLPDLGAGVDLGVDATIKLPEEILLDPSDDRVNLENNTVKVTGTVKDNALEVNPVKITGFDLSGYDFAAKEDLTGSIKVSGSVFADNPSVDINEISGEIAVNVSSEIRNINFSKITGRVDYDIEEINQSVKLEGIPDFLKDESIVLDLAAPHLVIKTKSNIGIPVDGVLSVIPVIGGVEGEAVTCALELPRSESAAEVKETTFWIAQDKNGCPSDYEYLPANIRKLIRVIPDELKISLTAGTATGKDCIVEPSADYSLDVVYEFVAPLQFGNEFHIERKDTIKGIGEDIGKIVKENSVRLEGSVTNTLPLQLNLKIDLLDGDGNVIPLANAKDAVLAISTCSSDGSASVSPIGLTLKGAKNADMASLRSILLTYVVTSPNVADIPVREDSYLQAELKLALPEGITMDFKDFNNEK